MTRSNTSSDMLLVQYDSRYLEEILALHRSVVAGFNLGISQREDEADLLAIEQVYLPDGEFLVGLRGRQLIAMGGFQRLSDTVAELRRMRIDVALQGRGYGTQLLQQLEHRAAELGVQELRLETAEARALTLKFYRKHAYQQTGAGFYGAVPTVCFTKSLGAPS